jgi:chromosome segregation ATPase
MRFGSVFFTMTIASACAAMIALSGEPNASPVADQKTPEQQSAEKECLGEIRAKLQAADQLLAPMAEIGKAISAMAADGADQRSSIKEALAGVAEVQAMLPGLKEAFAEAERAGGPNGGEAAVSNLEKSLARLEDQLREAKRNLENQDDLDVDVQELLAGLISEAEQIATNVLKKADDIKNACIGKT